MVWALLAPAVVIALVQWNRPDGKRVMVVGAGLVHQLVPEDAPRGSHAPKGTFYDLSTVAHEPLGGTEQRVQETLRGWPDVIVIGIDASALVDAGAIARAQRVLATLTKAAENATAVPVVLSPAPGPGDGGRVRAASEELHDWFRRELCQQPGLRLCVDVLPHAGDVAAVRAAVGAAVLDAVRRHDALRASTQVGR
jgi:hypothetical protein